MSLTSRRIVVVGSSNTDLVVNAARIPRAGETVLGESFLMAPGGKGANQAVGAARLGADVTLVARIGNDAFGAQALEGFAREQIDTDYIVRDESAASGVALIVVDQTGENAIAVAPGANRLLTVADVEAAREPIASADVLLLQLEVPLQTVKYAARIAADAGVPVILNPAPAQPLDAETLRLTTVLTPNQHEALALARPFSDGNDSLRTIGRRLRDAGAHNVVITLGNQGALLITERQAQQVAAPKVKSVDSTAAGDAFNGALAYALAGAEPLVEAVRFASLAGALAVTRRGAQPSLPTRAEMAAFAETVHPPQTEPSPK